MVSIFCLMVPNNKNTSKKLGLHNTDLDYSKQRNKKSPDFTGL